ncbi:MAG TPA: hypothetical protein VGD98_07780 [Ktedonobacteraceae bacterium]
MKIVQKPRYTREESTAYVCQETLAAAIARGRYEERRSICEMMRRMLEDIAETRFPTVAPFIKGRVAALESFAVLHQFLFVISTAWAPEDVLRFMLAFDDNQEAMR